MNNLARSLFDIDDEIYYYLKRYTEGFKINSDIIDFNHFTKMLGPKYEKLSEKEKIRCTDLFHMKYFEVINEINNKKEVEKTTSKYKAVYESEWDLS